MEYAGSFNASSDRESLVHEGINESDDIVEPDEPPRKRQRLALSHINVTSTAFPRSAYEGYIPRHPEVSETDALSHLEAAFAQAHATDEEQPEHIIFALDEFDVYLPDSSERHKGELVSLDRLQNKDGYGEFLLDGVLKCGRRQCYIKGVQFSTLTLDGYGDLESFLMDDQLCIQSKQGRNRNIWYQLGQPSGEYNRFYEPFVWLSTFTKQFVEYLLQRPEAKLNDFRRRFREWLDARHMENKDYVSWLNECRNLTDFRTTVSANAGFLLKEAYSIDHKLRRSPLWREVYPWDLTAIPYQPERERLTVLTPFVYECFRRMYFRGHLKMRAVTDEVVLARIAARKSALGLTAFGALECLRASAPSPTRPRTLEVQSGDVVVVAVDTNGPWKDSRGVSFAYVQRVRQLVVRTVLDIIWLYEPCDTTLRNAHYPFPNELFMSDNCECGASAIDLDCVTGKMDLVWSPRDAGSVAGPFVRQTYHTNPRDDKFDFVTLRQSHFACDCAERTSDFEDCRRNYLIGDTALIRQRSRELDEDVLEPAQVIGFDRDRAKVILRRLDRKTRLDSNAKSNELLLTNDVFEKSPSRIVRRCHVRFFEPSTADAGLPVPYDRNGAGDFYFILTSNNIASEDETVDVQTSRYLPPLKQGPDLAAIQQTEKLIGMGIFSGGGNFDRGLAEGGAVHFKYAVDYAKNAIHTYRANVAEEDDVRLFYGSVDDYLSQAMEARQPGVIAQPGDIDFQNGGSPCPGFSNLQQDKGSFESLRNASKVASFVSFVDFFVPSYCMLENVVSMTKDMGPAKGENVFAQILAALVGLGYQVQQFLMDADAVGSAENRARVIIIASAPGLEPLSRPPTTHAYSKFISKTLGKTSNGLSFGGRQDLVVPFQSVSASAATADLPDIGDSQPQMCPAFPDHRTPSDESAKNRNRIASIPKHPRGMGLAQAARKGLLRGEPLDFFNTIQHRCTTRAKTYCRVEPDGQFPIITTACRPRCYQTGRVLHWDQDRLTTVMEIRRAQGYPDHEVILGTPGEQVRIIGNGVNRYVGLTLGLALRESWINSDESVRRRVQCPVAWSPTREYVSDSGYDEQVSVSPERRIMDYENTIAWEVGVRSNFSESHLLLPASPSDSNQGDRDKHQYVAQRDVCQRIPVQKSQPGLPITAESCDTTVPPILNIASGLSSNSRSKAKSLPPINEETSETRAGYVLPGLLLDLDSSEDDDNIVVASWTDVVEDASFREWSSAVDLAYVLV